MTKPSDLELVQQVRSGNRPAYTHLMQRYLPQVYWIARRLTGSHREADEIARETFVKAYLGLGDFRNDSIFLLWLYRIAISLSFNAVRKRHLVGYIRESDLLNRFLPPSDNSPGTVESWEKESRLHRAIAGLPEKQKALFVMRWFDDLTYEEISAVLNASGSGLQRSYIHALRKVKEYLRDEA